jgi:hypothetical protein
MRFCCKLQQFCCSCNSTFTEGPVLVLRDGGMRLKFKWDSGFEEKYWREAGFYSIAGGGIKIPW